MKVKEINIIYALMFSRGSFSNDKRRIIKNRLATASPGFLHQAHLYFDICLLLKLTKGCSFYRICEHTRIKSKIPLSILIQFGFIDWDISRAKHIYTLTPLGELIINDLIEAYKTQIKQFDDLNFIDKKTDYFTIKEKIKQLKQK